MKLLSSLFLSVALLLPAAAFAEKASSAKTDASTKAPAIQIDTPPAGKGQIVFFRPPKFVGGAFGYKVREGETELGKLRSGKYFVAAVAPGTHKYNVHAETKDELNLEIEAGETYYVKATVSIGVFAGRPNLAPSTKAEFDEISEKLDPAK